MKMQLSTEIFDIYASVTYSIIDHTSRIHYKVCTRRPGEYFILPGIVLINMKVALMEQTVHGRDIEMQLALFAALNGARPMHM